MFDGYVMSDFQMFSHFTMAHLHASRIYTCLRVGGTSGGDLMLNLKLAPMLL